jgi:hypothetical protein
LKGRRVFGTRRLFACVGLRRREATALIGKIGGAGKIGKIKARKEERGTEIFSEIVVETNAEIC